jgi:hypothetical protein
MVDGENFDFFFSKIPQFIYIHSTLKKSIIFSHQQLNLKNKLSRGSRSCLILIFVERNVNYEDYCKFRMYINFVLFQNLFRNINTQKKKKKLKDLKCDSN